MKIDIETDFFYDHDSPELKERTKQRLIQIKKIGMTEVGLGQFGVKHIMSGLYIEMLWEYDEIKWDDYISWASDLITTKRK